MKNWLFFLIVVLFLLPFYTYSQTSTPQQPLKKIALVIGNGNYLSGNMLSNPENDAKAMKVALQNVGFIVMEYENLNQVQMKKAIDDFGMKLKSKDVGLFFYAGHGIQSKGYNYLIPIDAQLQSEQQVEYDCVQADRVLALMEASGAKINIIILDACRNNPFERSWTRSATGRGLAFMNAPSGTLIAYATSPGSTASDGSGKNGLYTSAILESIKIPNITIIQMFQNVRSIVSKKSNKQQIPWESTSMTGDFYFKNSEILLSENQLKTQDSQSIDSSIDEGSDYIIDSRDNQEYKIIKIGNQVWMAENLRATKFNDGVSIPLVTETVIWSDLTTPGYCWYDNDAISNKNIYGAIYNWYSVNTGILCPLDWHVPTDEDWTTLTTYLGGEDVAGGKLKESGTTHWQSPNTGATNLSGFLALPSGNRDAKAIFIGKGATGCWWSTSQGGTGYAYYRYLHYSTSELGTYYTLNRNGFSVRCIKD